MLHYVYKTFIIKLPTILTIHEQLVIYTGIQKKLKQFNNTTGV